MEEWARLVLLASAAVLLVVALVEGDWLRVALYLALITVVGAGAWRSRGEAARQDRSSALVGSWPPARVRELSADAGGQHIATVKVLRTAEPELTLRDADHLVREALRQDAPPH